MKSVRLRKNLSICILLALVTAAVYARVYRHDFIDYDDGEYVFENPHVVRPITTESLAWAFTSGYASNWHPMTWLSHMLDCQLFGLNAGKHHLTSLLFHAVNVILLFLVLQSLAGDTWKAAFVAGLFALHPLHVESVAWIAERKDVLSTFFLLLTIWAYAGYVRKPGYTRYVLSILLFAAGLMAKPMLVTLPFVLLLLDFWPLNRFSTDAGSRKEDPGHQGWSGVGSLFKPARLLLREKIPFFVLAAASSIVTFAVQKAAGAVKTAQAVPFDTRIANALNSYLSYLEKTLWPTDLSIFYRYPAAGYPPWRVALAALFVVCVTVLAVRSARRAPYLPVGWFWYLGMLVPVIGLVQVGWQAMADRYTYVPLIGIFIAAAWGIPALVKNRAGGRRALAAAGIVLLAACAIGTWFQIAWWRNTTSLFSRALEIDRDHYLAHAILATDLARHGKYRDAITHYSESLRLDPGQADTTTNFGYALQVTGKVTEALEQYSKALQLVPDYPIAIRNTGLALNDQGKFEKAIEYLQKARRRLPDDFITNNALGNAFAKLGRIQEALEAYNRVLHVQPDNVQASLAIGLLLANQGRGAEAISSLEEVLKSRPGDAEIHDRLGSLLFTQGRVETAISEYAKALQLNPQMAEAHYNMGVALFSQGKQAEAIAQYREAIRIKPDYATAYYNLATALESRGDVQGAVANYIEATRLKPDYAEAYNNLGIAMFNQGQVEKALRAFSEALRARPDYAEARRNRDLILANLGSAKPKP